MQKYYELTAEETIEVDKNDNIYELSVETNLTTFDMFLGKSVGGIATTNILLILI